MSTCRPQCRVGGPPLRLLPDMIQFRVVNNSKLSMTNLKKGRVYCSCLLLGSPWEGRQGCCFVSQVSGQTTIYFVLESEMQTPLLHPHHQSIWFLSYNMRAPRAWQSTYFCASQGIELVTFGGKPPKSQANHL